MSIVEAEGIKASAEEVETELKDVAMAYNTDLENIKKMIGVENITYVMKDIQLKKVIEMLYDKAEVTMVPEKEEKEEEKTEEDK